jgi:hypothetical protein
VTVKPELRVKEHNGIVNLARVPVGEPPLLQGVGCLAVQAGHFVPGCKPDCPRGSVAGSGDSVSVGSEVGGDGINDGEETRGTAVAGGSFGSFCRWGELPESDRSRRRSARVTMRILRCSAL